MENFAKLTEEISGLLWGWPLIALLVGTHIYLTIRLHFPQRHIITAIKLTFKKDKSKSGDISAFRALATALAATIGTGNLVGVGTAIALGGPGAVFWCWLTGLLGMATKYGEGLLAVKFRVRTSNGEMLGGPMYALERGLGMKWLAILFCIFTAIATFGIGNMVQANAVADLMKADFGIATWKTGAITTVLVGSVMLGGVKSISRACGLIVPFMAVFYIIGCIYIIICNHAYLTSAIDLIITSAIDPSAAGAGFTGGMLINTIRYGVSRGLFSNESGMGSAPIIAAAAKAKNPVRQALVSMTGTFWDTVIICAMTGIVIVSCMIAHPEIEFKAGTAMMRSVFGTIPVVGPTVLTIGLFTFAFSTLLGWSYYGEKAIEYLGGKKWITSYRVVFVIAILIGSILSLSAVWNIADCMNALMAIPNLISLLLLSNVLVKETRKYLWDKNGLNKWDKSEITIEQLAKERRLKKKMKQRHHNRW